MAKRRNYRYFKPSKISEDLLCIICQDVFKEPVQLPCNHTLCEECVARWIKSNNSCPLCRKAFTRKELKIAKEMLVKIEKIPVVCSFPECCWLGALGELEEHEKKCAFNPVSCKNEVLQLLPKYEKMGEDDIDTPVISLITILYEKHSEIISKVLLNKQKIGDIIEENEHSTHKKKHKIKTNDQQTIDRFLRGTIN